MFVIKVNKIVLTCGTGFYSLKLKSCVYFLCCRLRNCTGFTCFQCSLSRITKSPWVMSYTVYIKPLSIAVAPSHCLVQAKCTRGYSEPLKAKQHSAAHHVSGWWCRRKTQSSHTHSSKNTKWVGYLWTYSEFRKFINWYTINKKYSIWKK